MSQASNEQPYRVNISTNKEDSPWWAKDISSVLLPAARKMLEEYAHIPPNEVIDHISQARERAWTLAPFASIGALTWLNPYILLHPAHDRILAKVKAGATILDCACFISPDLRQLAYEGAPTGYMYGFDIEDKFFPISYDFYRDRDTFRGTLFAADGLEDFSKTPLGALRGKMDIVWCPKYLHLFDRPNQIIQASRLIELLKPQAGSMFVGSQNGYPGALDVAVRGGGWKGQQDTIFLGDEAAIKEMWKEVAEKTGTKWDLQARLLDMRTIGLHDDDGSEYKKRTGYNLQWTATLIEPAVGS